MLIESVKHMSPESRLVYWITERHRIKTLKDKGVPKPWTNDVILQSYRFCNVRRMDDTVSQWLYNNWYKPYYNHKNMVVAATIARHFNKPEALHHITCCIFKHKYDPVAIKRIMRELKTGGQTIFNGAYMVRGIGTADKTEMVVDKVCQPLLDNPPKLDTSSMEASVEALLPYWGFSHFMAGQVVADLRWAMKGTWADKKKWAAIGPGSKRGMNRFKSRPINQPLHQEQFNNELQELIAYCTERIPLYVTNNLEGIDWQNICCESDKYSRVLLGEGRPKQIYNGRA